MKTIVMSPEISNQSIVSTVMEKSQEKNIFTIVHL